VWSRYEERLWSTHEKYGSPGRTRTHEGFPPLKVRGNEPTYVIGESTEQVRGAHSLVVWLYVWIDFIRDKIERLVDRSID